MNYKMRIKFHTGCSCTRCKRGKDKKTRSLFHRKMRRKQKKELHTENELKTVNLSIGYTD